MWLHLGNILIDIDTEITIDDNCTDDLKIWLSIIDDLVNRYNLDIQYTKEQKND